MYFPPLGRHLCHREVLYLWPFYKLWDFWWEIKTRRRLAPPEEGRWHRGGQQPASAALAAGGVRNSVCRRCGDFLENSEQRECCSHHDCDPRIKTVREKGHSMWARARVPRAGSLAWQWRRSSRACLGLGSQEGWRAKQQVHSLPMLLLELLGGLLWFRHRGEAQEME